jgi:hypothetical protein
MHAALRPSLRLTFEKNISKFCLNAVNRATFGSVKLPSTCNDRILRDADCIKHPTKTGCFHACIGSGKLHHGDCGLLPADRFKAHASLLGDLSF